MNDASVVRHWTREPWPWILMALPASAVVAGFVTLWFALNTNNSMVVDDYYKEGKAINQRIARDSQAASLGMQAQVQLNGSALSVLLRGHDTILPKALGARFVHVAHAEHDRNYVLNAGPDGRYALGQLDLVDGRYRVHLEPPSLQWRLVSEVFSVTGEPVDVAIRSGAIARYRVEADK